MSDNIYGYIMPNSKEDQKLIFNHMSNNLDLLRKKKEVIAKKSFDEVRSFIKELKETLDNGEDLTSYQENKASLPIDVLMEDFIFEINKLNIMIDGKIINVQLSNQDIKEVLESLLTNKGDKRVLVREKDLPTMNDFNKDIVVNKANYSIVSPNSTFKSVGVNMFFNQKEDKDDLLFDLFFKSLKDNAISRNLNSYLLKNKNGVISDVFSSGKIEAIITASKLKGQSKGVLIELWDQVDNILNKPKPKQNKDRLNY